MAPPRWATNLVNRVARDYRVLPPRLEWRTRRRKTSAGSCPTADPRNISVTAGRDTRDQRLTILHELGHYILLRRRSIPYQGEHDERFYTLVWEMYRRYRVPVRFALEMEAHYRPRAALAAYRKVGGRLG